MPKLPGGSGHGVPTVLEKSETRLVLVEFTFRTFQTFKSLSMENEIFVWVDGTLVTTTKSTRFVDW